MPSKRNVDRMVRRARDVLARIGEHTDFTPTEVIAAVICNECGDRLLVQAPNRVALEQSLSAALDGWRITEKPEDDDLCPKCVSGLAAA